MFLSSHRDFSQLFQERGEADDAAVSEAAKYEKRVLEDANQPPWAVRLEQKLDRIVAMVSKHENALTASAGPFEEVPFPNGTYPWGKQANTPGGQVVLPNLDREQAVRNLTLHESYGYYAGYYPNHNMPGGVNATALRVNAILKAIGKGDLVT